MAAGRYLEEEFMASNVKSEANGLVQLLLPEREGHAGTVGGAS